MQESPFLRVCRQEGQLFSKIRIDEAEYSGLDKNTFWHSDMLKN